MDLTRQNEQKLDYVRSQPKWVGLLNTALINYKYMPNMQQCFANMCSMINATYYLSYFCVCIFLEISLDKGLCDGSSVWENFLNI